MDTTVVPGPAGIQKDIEDSKHLAIKRCVAAGGNSRTIEVVEIDVIPISYVTNGATRLLVRVVGDLVDGYEELHDDVESPAGNKTFRKLNDLPRTLSDNQSTTSKGSSYEIKEQIDLQSYRPRIEGDLWYLSELDLQFLQDGTGVLAVGSCGEPYPSYVACLLALRSGEGIIVRRQDTLPDDAVVLVAGFMVTFSDLFKCVR